MRLPAGIGIPVSLMLLTLLLSLSGCGAAPEPTPTPTPEYTVSFYADDSLLAQMSVTEGQTHDTGDIAVPGRVILGWLDESGAEVSPGSVPVYSDLSFRAETAPALERHSPYLFADERGFLRPDDTLTRSELRLAFLSLMAEGNGEYIDFLPDDAEPVTGEILTDCLSRFLPDAVSVPEGDVTRAGFAAIMNSLLGRTGETVAVAQGECLFPDVPPEREDFAELLEAGVSHEVSPEGTAWDAVTLSPVYESGFLNIDGALYCVDDAGYILRDAEYGGLYFGEDGTYSSGDEALDVYVRELVRDMISENPDADRLSLLRLAYDYTRDSFEYLRREAYEIGAEGWQNGDALTMFETGRGNCYCYAAVFCSLARNLGYDARALSGTISKTYQPHAWVEIDFDGETFYFDPETEMAYRRKGEYGVDMFKMAWIKASQWSYRH